MYWGPKIGLGWDLSVLNECIRSIQGLLGRECGSTSAKRFEKIRYCELFIETVGDGVLALGGHFLFRWGEVV